ncbi:MAG: DPP IV N-terminal domain-containing protein, partial [Longimicrobiales bacterium]
MKRTRDALALVVLLAAAPAAAQQPYAPEQLTAQDYQRAERLLRENTAPLVFGADVRPVWLDDGRFWYRNTIPEGAEYVLVDARSEVRERAFDHARLAAALSAAADTTIDAFALPLGTLDFSADARSVTAEVGDRRFTCDVEAYTCGNAPDPLDRNVIVSPDGRLGAFVREHDLWVRDLATGAETRLTTDGEEDFGYATNNAGWTRSDRPVLLWSPDSRRIATFQHDARGVGEMVLATTNVGHPHAEIWKYPLPGDSAIFMIHRVIIDVEAGNV